MSEVIKTILIFLFTFSALRTIADIGKPRDSIQPRDAVAVVVVAILLILGVVNI